MSRGFLVIEKPHRGVLGSLGFHAMRKDVRITHRDLVVMQMSEVGGILAL
jgi:hypothetical protein